MKRVLGSNGPCPRSPHAFTMVELLVVIVIIVILIGLLVPAVAAVRRVAKETASKAALQTIDTGLETYKADGKLGGEYPPSYSDAPGGSGMTRGMVVSPYTGQNITISGAGLLVWAMSGADLLGTPGFSRFASTTAVSWAEMTGSDPQFGGAYALDSNSKQPLHQRFGPYVDASKLKITRNEGTQATPNFIVPEESKALKALGLAPVTRTYPLYLDAFGYPILYWRADPAGRQMADVGRNEGDPRGFGLYHWEDNAGLLTDTGPMNDPDTNTSPLLLNKAGEEHALGFGNQEEFRNNPNANTPLTQPGFPRYIWNDATKARYEPQRSSSFILASPGADGLYGTADDVTDFEHHGK